MDKNMRSYLAELVGTFGFVFISAGAACATYFGGDATTAMDLSRRVYVAVATGFALAAALAFTMPYEGGYLNPAVTLTLWVYKRIEGVKALGLIFVQFLGAVLAGGLLFAILGNYPSVLRTSSLGTPHVQGEIIGALRSQVFAGCLTEFCLTLVLTLVIFGTVIDPRAPQLLGPTGKWLTPLWIGLAMGAIVLAGFPLTGASANPARWFGTVVWEYAVPDLRVRDFGPFRDQLAYWIGPILGALLAGGVYNALMLPTPEHAPAHATAPKPHPVGSTLFRSKK